MKKAILLSILMLFTTVGFASVTPNSPVTPQTPQRESVQFLPADTPGTYKTVYTAGTNGSLVLALMEANNDSATHVLTCSIVNGGTNYGLLWATTAAGDGFSVAGKNLFAATATPLPTQSDGNPFIYLVNGDTLACTYATAVTAAKQVNLTAIGEDF